MTDLTSEILIVFGEHVSNMFRVSTTEVNKALAIYDKQNSKSLSILRDLLDDMRSDELTSLASDIYNTDRLKAFRDAIKDWQNELNTQIYAEIKSGLAPLATNEVAFVAGVSGQALAGIALPTASAVVRDSIKTPSAGGALVKEMFDAIGVKTAEIAKKAIREGITQGMTNQQIFKQIKGSPDFDYEDSQLRTVKRDIDAIVRTTRMHVANEAYLQTWTALGYKHLKIVATLDGRTCKVCAMLDGNVYPIDGAKPNLPGHARSRTVYVGCDANGVLIGKRAFVMDSKPVKDIPKSERAEKIGRVNANTNYETFFKNASVEFQKDWLGPTRYKLYKEGGYTIDRFVDPLGKELTISALKADNERLFKRLES